MCELVLRHCKCDVQKEDQLQQNISHAWCLISLLGILLIPLIIQCIQQFIT